MGGNPFRDRDALFWRRCVQLGFAALTLWMGVVYVRFVTQAQAGGPVTVERPPGVEGFMPISGMLGLRHWLETGGLNTIHPAAVVLFLAIVATALVAKKGFCSWVCPVGTLSEGLALLGQRIFGRNFLLPRWLDWPMRAIKYALLAFFLWIVIYIPGWALEPFLYGDYHRVSDVKTYLFFAEITPGALAVVAALILGSIPIRGLWCRYCCPYGALLGLAGLFSVMRIRRDPASCADCRSCTEACPQQLQVHAERTIASPECTACQTCVDVCPQAETLSFGPAKRSIPPWGVALALIAVFVVAVGGARLTGHWRSSVSTEEYTVRIQSIDEVGHARAVPKRR